MSGLKKVELLSVEIYGVEGTHNYCNKFPMTLSKLSDANGVLENPPLAMEGGFKHSFKLNFTDGMVYTGNLYVNAREDLDTNIGSHVEKYLNSVVESDVPKKSMMYVSLERKNDARMMMEMYDLNS